MITKPILLDETGQKIKQAIIRVKNKFLGQDDSAVTPGSAASSGTAAVMQDDTGRDIISALNDLGDAVKPASTTDSGLVTTEAQTFAGEKTFTGRVKAPFFEGNRAFTRELTSADDLNNIKDFGWYYEPSAGATYMPANVPYGFTGAFTLEVYPATGNYVNSGAWAYITQRLKPFNTIQYYERLVYTDGNGQWSYLPWNLLPDDASATKGGYVNTIAQTFAGSKTFQEIITAQGFRGTSQNANAQTIIQPVGFIEYATIGAQDVFDTNTVTKLLQWITTNYPTRTRETIFIGTLAAGSSHMFALMPYDTSIVSGGVPQYSVGIDITFNHTYLFGSFGYSPYVYTTY